MKIELEPIGVIHSPYLDLEEMPIQPAGAKGIKGSAELFNDFVPGLKDLDGFSHIILLYHFHCSSSYKLQVVPFLDTVQRGLFATRAPRRPNQIGLSIVRLDSIKKNVLHLRNVDILEGTPLLDIKPYVPAFDTQNNVRCGWLEQPGQAVSERKSDNRFT